MESDEYIKKERELYNILIASLKDNERNIEAEYTKSIEIKGKKYTIHKNKGLSSINVSGEERELCEYYLNKTTFKEDLKEFIPVSYQELRYFLKESKDKYNFICES